MDTQLLCTFTKSYKLNETIENIKGCYKLAFNKIYILENVEDEKEYICSYNIDINYDINSDLIPLNTISVHRKKETNTIYTINALNYIITLLNDGIMDNRFPIPWENYKNQLLVTNVDGLKRIPTKIKSVFSV